MIKNKITLLGFLALATFDKSSESLACPIDIWEKEQLGNVQSSYVVDPTTLKYTYFNPKKDDGDEDHPANLKRPPEGKNLKRKNKKRYKSKIKNAAKKGVTEFIKNNSLSDEEEKEILHAIFKGKKAKGKYKNNRERAEFMHLQRMKAEALMVAKNAAKKKAFEIYKNEGKANKVVRSLKLDEFAQPNKYKEKPFSDEKQQSRETKINDLKSLQEGDNRLDDEEIKLLAKKQAKFEKALKEERKKDENKTANLAKKGAKIALRAGTKAAPKIISKLL